VHLGTIAALHADADLLVGFLVGTTVGLLAGPLLRAWLTFLEWTHASREAELTEELIDRLDRELDEHHERRGASSTRGPWPTPR
jgi:hypothetical protein